jgi:hypothetical protein
MVIFVGRGARMRGQENEAQVSESNRKHYFSDNTQKTRDYHFEKEKNSEFCDIFAVSIVYNIEALQYHMK